MKTDMQKQLGQILLELRLVNQATLNKALQKQKDKHLPLGQVLLQMKALKNEDLERALTQQFGIVYLNPKTFRLADKSLLTLIPVQYADKWCCFPLERKKDTLQVATTDPFNSDALEDLSKITKLTVKFVYSRYDWILELIHKYYTT